MEARDLPPYRGYRYDVRPQRVCFSAVLLRNSVLSLVILVSNRVWVCHSTLELGTFFRRNYFFININKTINKSPSQCLQHRSELGN